jgi:hypothetical protein
MSRYWNWTSNLSPGEIARSQEVNDNFSAIDAGLDAVELEMNRSIRFTNDSNPAESYFQIAESPAQRASKALGFDSAGKAAIVSVLWNWRDAWLTSTAYAVNDVVSQGAEKSLYVCRVAHTSGTFATDLAASKWTKVIDLTEVSRAIRKQQIVTNAMSPFVATAGDDLLVDVAGGAVTITLPASPSINDQAISITHIDGNIGTNNITVARNGNLIMALAENMVVNDTNAAFELAYSDASRGWRLVRGT